MRCIDFHSHHIPKRFELTAARFAPANQRGRWHAIARRISDEDLLLQDIRTGHLDARVVSIPAQLIADADGKVPLETIRATNDELGALVARHPGHIYGLASVNAYDGERSGYEAERAIRTLGLHGLFVECARGELMIDALQARPTLAAAAEQGVPVFVHPVAPQPLTRQMAPYGIIGTLFARGTVNAAALIALVEGGVLAELPDLRVVVTAHAIGGLAMLTGLSAQSRLPCGAAGVMRRQVFVDTTLPHPAVLRAAIDLLGGHNVVAGSDWPIGSHEPLCGALAEAMAAAGLSGAEQAAVMGENGPRLLRASLTSSPGARPGRPFHAIGAQCPETFA
jgi:predicted TIM-barrel fold metal-dependent hydrolase